MSKEVLNEQRQKGSADRVWLSYYNWVLYEKRVITERGHNKMEVKISIWKMTMTREQIRGRKIFATPENKIDSWRQSY